MTGISSCSRHAQHKLACSALPSNSRKQHVTNKHCMLLSMRITGVPRGSGRYPFPADAPTEGAFAGCSITDCDTDRHVLVVDNYTCTLYEAWRCEWPSSATGGYINYDLHAGVTANSSFALLVCVRYCAVGSPAAHSYTQWASNWPLQHRQLHAVGEQLQHRQLCSLHFQQHSCILIST